MTLLETLRKDHIQAMKDKDILKKGELSLLVSALALAEKEKHEPLTEEEGFALIQKELKQAKETLEATPSDRPELIEETTQKIALIESYLPAQMSEEEVKKAIETILQEKGLEPIKKNQGVIMKEMMAKYTGVTDGKTVSRIAQTLLK